MANLRIGSRGSQLALWQSNHVAELLRGQGHKVEIEVIKTTGDKILDVALAKVGTKGMFTKEIEETLAAGRIDLAVHSMKDVLTELDSRFTLAAIMKREQAGDAFISIRYHKIESLPAGARVGTSSLRRQCQVKALRPDVEVIPLRGNVDTRLKKLEAGEYDAIILAAAGVGRLGLDKHVRYFISRATMCPAAGQGALGIETRWDDQETRKHVSFLDDANTRAEVVCERDLLRALGGGCQVPIGVSVTRDRGEFWLAAMVGRPDGSEVLRESAFGRDPEDLVRRVLEKLRERGVDKILSDVYGQEAAVPRQP